VTAGEGGDISINAHNLAITNSSQLRAGIAEGMGTSQAVGGDIIINATGDVRFSGIKIDELVNFLIEKREPFAGVFNEVGREGKGNTGNISITANSVELSDGVIVAKTYGEGNVGNVEINTIEIVKLTDSNIFSDTGIFSQVSEGGQGNGGMVSITADSVELLNSYISTSSFGLGNAGSVEINATHGVYIEGQTLTGIFSGGNGEVGNGGEILMGASHLGISINT